MRGVAIIGMACRFPGANDIDTFWRNLESGVDSIRHFSDAELLRAGIPEKVLTGPDYVKAAPVIDDFDMFDAGFFEYSAREARLMDPQQRILLEEAWHALEDSGWPPGSKAGRVGVFAGSGGVVTSYLLAHPSLHGATTGGLEHLANDKDFLSTRLSYKLGLTGPSVNVQTACSTSLVAVHLACQSILDGECDMALAGGSTVRVPQVTGYFHRQGDIMSPDGRCRAYDAAAEGTVFGSGTGVVVLKHVEEAVADGDRIYAVILGSAINNDGGEKVSYTASSTEGQARAMAAAFAAAEVGPSTIHLVEGHGTGTVVGDPLEVEALRRCFVTDPKTRSGRCWLGSVKTNIGHLEQAAGVASLIKAALALHHGRIPPSLNFREPNPRTDLGNGPFRVPISVAEWPREDHPRRAAVNSLGLGGTNAFAILEEAPQISRETVAERPMHVLALSARSTRALGRLVHRWRDHLAGPGGKSANAACYTAARGRAAMRYRCAVSASDGDGLARALIDVDPETSGATAGRKLAFLFPGQGAQYPGMARTFHESEPVFREAFDSVAEPLRERAGLDITRVVYEQDDPVALAHTEVLQPALFAVEWALTEMLRHWGVRPDAVLGHSVGAFAAAAAAGIYALEDAIDLISRRGALMGALPAGGAMAALFADADTIAELSREVESTAVAAVNSPENTVVSGESSAVAALCELAARRGIDTRPLSVSHAFHSPLMEPAASPLTKLATSRVARAPAISFVSDLTGQAMEAEPAPGYLADHLLNPVRFMDGLRTLAGLGCTDFLEVGPGSALRGFAAATLSDVQPELHGLFDPRRGDWETTAATLARLWERGFAVDLAQYHGGRGSRLVSAPLYSFERVRYWLKDAPAGEEDDGGGLVGREVRVPGSRRHFQARYSAARQAWLLDHRIYGHVTLPVAAALAGLAEAGAIGAGAAVEVRNLTYSEACVLAEDEDRLLDFDLPADLSSGEAVLSSTNAGSDTWRTHIRATVQSASDEQPETLDLAALRQRCRDEVEPTRYYATLDRLGLNYGPGFRNVRELYLGERMALARVALSDQAPDAQAAVHPAALDGCLHLFPAVSGLHDFLARTPVEEGVTFLPVTVERFTLFGEAPATLWAHCLLRAGEDPAEGRYTVDIRIHAEDGRAVAVIEGLTVKRLTQEAFLPRQKAPVEDWLYSLDWIARPALPEPEASSAGRWLVVADDPADVRFLVDALEAVAADCQIVKPEALQAEGETTSRPALAEVPLAGVLLATALSEPPLMTLGPDDLGSRTRWQFQTMQAVLAFLSERLEGASVQPRLWLLTRGAQAPQDDRLGGEALQAMLWGYGRVIALEHPSLHGGLIDLDEQTEGSSVVREILCSDGEDQVAFRDGRRYVPRLVRRGTDLTDQPVRPSIRADRSYLVTGGLGTLGLKVADWLLAGQGARHVWLVSRRAPSEEQRARIADLEALGATVRIVSADISDAAEAEGLIRRIVSDGPPLDGVFHCAGLLEDGIMIEMDWERFHRVTAAKVEGAWALHSVTEEMDLGHFVLFSSILSVIGSMGQVNYVAGNAFLDVLVAYRRRLGLPATAMNWGPWEEAGLATHSGERGRAIWRARGTRYIPVDHGMEAMTRTLAHGFDHMIVTLTDWSRFVSQFAEPPRLYEALAAGAGEERRRSRPSRAEMLERLKSASPGERRGVLVEALCQICAAVLEADAPPEPDVSLREAGLDSLMSITLNNEIESSFGARLPARALLRGPSVVELAEMVFQAQPALLGTAGGGSEATAGKPGADVSRTKVPADRDAGRPGSWLVVKRPRKDARIRLFCFPFAGGGSAVFDHWGDAFDTAVEIVAVEPPGRLGRINEAPVRTVEAFARGLLPELTERLDRPYAVLGHCLGGLTLYETLRFLEAREKPMPTHIFVSGARPPSVLRAPGDFERELDTRLRRYVGYRAGQPGFEQPDEVFSEIIRAFGIADSAAMLEEAELRDLVLPTVRAEFAMANRYIYLPEAPFPVPITCFRGGRDEYFREIDAKVWSKFTSKRFEIFTRDTGHFAIVEDFDFIRQAIETRLLGQRAARA